MPNDNNNLYTSRTQKYHGDNPPPKKKPEKKQKVKISEDDRQEEYIQQDDPVSSEIHGVSNDTEYVSKPKKELSAKTWVITVCIVIAAMILLNIFVFSIAKMEGDSMNPTIDSGEYVIVNKISAKINIPEKGDIVMADFPGYSGYYIKRVIALSGETVEIKDGVLFINDTAQKEDYISSFDYPDMEKITVPEGCVFVAGDNRANSLDSRSDKVGCIPTDNINALLFASIWPFSSIRTFN